jgi:putative NIF3 family GTP cyclohydrolase 1 type 2
MAKTIQQVIDTILAAIPGAPLPETVDTFKSGDPSQYVTGIVTTFIATLDVLRKTVQLGANLVITHEPTYYNHWDKVDWLENDPVYKAKRAFIEESGLTIWRFHDHWHMNRPDGVITGIVKQLGWEAYQDAEQPNLIHLPPTPLPQLVAFLKLKFSLPSLRVSGDAGITCRQVGLEVGSGSGEWHIDLFGKTDVDTLICGEVNVWQVCEYTRDSVTAGRPRALILAGHEITEEPGMAYLVDWLRPKLPGIPISHVSAENPITFI